MGYQEIQIKLPSNYTDADLERALRKGLGLGKDAKLHYQIENKSLDARKKSNIHWLLTLSAVSPELSGEAPAKAPELVIPKCGVGRRAYVVGSGPAGYFAASVLVRAGFDVTLFERGAAVDERAQGIERFERERVFDPCANYAFGEGGAGTFSDGKLTSRTKGISLEKDFVIQSYIRAGAPAEIAYLAHPHLGSDVLKEMMRRMREEFQALGGRIHFKTELKDLELHSGHVTSLELEGDCGGQLTLAARDVLVIASGHSAHDTYRMLMRRGVKFRNKNFAIGYRMEHEQKIINQAQWGCASLPGVKAAEYRLTAAPVYTFCMCPGGVIVPATAFADNNIVNGMSQYKRDGRYANAAVVSGLNLEKLMGQELAPEAALDWLGALERGFYDYAPDYRAPSCSIQSFLERKARTGLAPSTYPLGLKEAPLWEMLPDPLVSEIANGLRDFVRKLRGFEAGQLIGLESKTSSPIQAVRENTEGDLRCVGVGNLWLAGEGSGYAGGIVSSAVSGVKSALHALTT